MKVWIIVVTRKGMIEKPEIFLYQDLANKKFEKLSKSINLDYDEIAIFEKNIHI